MKHFVLFLFFVGLITTFNQSKAQSAVAFCTQTGAVGYSYDAYSESEAIKIALNNCYYYGGVNCVIVSSSPYGGYGAIAIQDLPNGARIIGVSLSQDSEYWASYYAKQAAYNRGATSPYILATWYDY